MSPKNISIRKAEPSDIPKIVELLKYVADESGCADIFDEAHSWEHVTGIICNGISFLAEMDEDVVGVLMCSYVDLGFAITSNLETAHLYVLPSVRNTRTTLNLLKAVEDHLNSGNEKKSVDAQNDVIVFHQTDYISAINGSTNNSVRVGRLYESRRYEGPVDIATVGEERRRVGVSYIYRGKPEVAPNT